MSESVSCCRDEVGEKEECKTFEGYKKLADMKGVICSAEEIQVKKDKQEALKDCERLTEIETKMDNHIRVKDGIGTKRDEEPDTANNLECACEIWKKKVEKLKTTQKSENEDPKEPEKYE
ncbi:hypothetical protein F8M41_010809 [Gigaspora margarita]|uniref:Uncharacterized protein n=1 Tax=Gigaspora margarita TaxID=4874 RepID=A0A8H4A100_GIGMA|nr:hypothetical protein F8M41_010809 [Gigaspora margarita]